MKLDITISMVRIGEKLYAKEIRQCGHVVYREVNPPCVECESIQREINESDKRIEYRTKVGIPYPEPEKPKLTADIPEHKPKTRIPF